ncbi:Hpt domain-containing protein [Methylobacterium iners]|uniref:HPt domain-containing protein n=1 Tax=Methylobacterium iners TaxID=418707 RepID=A0ABQ4RQU8_9HYPH|nr:Hpt domain-containing protein [Methylobacterium iners]GJD93141.1 hypothetical protein OCOJLMKI_0331 [Methylobacterium iners]
MARRIDLDAIDPLAFDEDKLDDVRSNVGQEQTDALLRLLAEELTERFGPSGSNAKKLAYEAHVMISSTGVLGFVGLSDLCRAVEEACRTGQDPSVLRTRLAEARDQVMSKIEALRRSPEAKE